MKTDTDADEDAFDREIEALRSNAEFMAFLAECEARARTHPSKSLDEIRRELSTET